MFLIIYYILHYYVQDTANSACLGAAYRAAHGLACMESKDFIPFNEFMEDKRPNFKLVCQPRADAAEVIVIISEKVLTAKKTIFII